MKTNLVLSSLFLSSLTLLACSGGDGEPAEFRGDGVGDGDGDGDGDNGMTNVDDPASGGTGNPSDPTAGGTTGDPTGSGGTVSSGGSPGAGGNTNSGGNQGTGGNGPGAGVVQACSTTVTGPTLCVEGVAGNPGDTITVGVYAMNASSCGGVGGIGGPIDLVDDYFLVTNPVDDPTAQAGTGSANNCLTYQTEDGFDSIHVWSWTQWTEGLGCDQLAPSGRYVEFQIAIDPSTPPGDYPMTWRNGLLVGDNDNTECTSWDFKSNGTAVDGFIRVN